MRSAEFSFGNMYFFGGRNNTLRNGIGGFFFTYTTAIGRCDGSVCFDGNTFGESKTSMTLLSSFYRLVAQEMTEGLRNWEPEKLVSWPTYARVQFENRKVQIEIPSALGNNVFFESYPETLKCRVWEARSGEGEEFQIANMVRYSNPNVLDEMDKEDD